ncbi:MAG: PEP-CTERM sorting domain-containing protein [Alphaproteobacteria bacterium]
MKTKTLLATASILAIAPGAALAGLPLLEVPEPASLALLAAPAAALVLRWRRRRAGGALSASPPPAAPAREGR